MLEDRLHLRGSCRTSWSLDRSCYNRPLSENTVRHQKTCFYTRRKVLSACTFNSLTPQQSLSHLIENTCVSNDSFGGSRSGSSPGFSVQAEYWPSAVSCYFRTTSSKPGIKAGCLDPTTERISNSTDTTVISMGHRDLRERKIASPKLGEPKEQEFKPCWIQLTGHEGSLMSNDNGEVLKTYCAVEARCLRDLQHDSLRCFVPSFYGEELVNGLRYVAMQDLLFEFRSPSVMDCKIGQRTYLEDEVMSTRLRSDMYNKMIAVDLRAPTAQEHRQSAVTKLRYMQWRETLSSTAKHGFRIEAIKHYDKPTNRNFKTTTSWSEIKGHILAFVQYDLSVANRYFTRLRDLWKALETSGFFASHEIIGSSLLFAHDFYGLTNVWMIDFSKTLSLPQGIAVDHRKPWIPGNHEEGYLVGLENLIHLFAEIQIDCC